MIRLRKSEFVIAKRCTGEASKYILRHLSRTTFHRLVFMAVVERGLCDNGRIDTSFMTRLQIMEMSGGGALYVSLARRTAIRPMVDIIIPGLILISTGIHNGDWGNTSRAQYLHTNGTHKYMCGLGL